MQFTGKIKLALPIAQGVGKTTGKAWTRQTFIIENEPQFAGGIVATVLRGDLMQWMAAHVGTEVTVDIDLRYREFNGKYYQDVVCWGCSVNGQRVMPAAQGAPQGAAQGAAQGAYTNPPF